MQGTNLPLRKWVIGIYLMSTSVEGASSVMLHRGLGVTRKSAQSLARKIRAGAPAGTNTTGTGERVADTPKRGRGRPVEKTIAGIEASAEEIRDAIFRARTSRAVGSNSHLGWRK